MTINIKRWQKMAGIIKEGEVVSLEKFRNKKERASYQNEILVTTDGQITSSPADWLFVKLTHEDQRDAIVDGDILAAEKLGAKIYEVGPSHEVKSQGVKEELNLSERISPEFSQDLSVYLSNIEIDKPKKNTRKNNKTNGAADVVDGPYKKVAVHQPFGDNKHKKDFLKRLHIESAIKSKTAKKLVLESVIDYLSEQEKASPLESPESPSEKKRHLRQKFKQPKYDSHILDPDTEQGRTNLTTNLVHSVKDLQARSNILNRQIGRAVDAKTRHEFKEQLIMMNDGLISLKERDVPNLLKNYLITVKQYERQRGRNIPIAVNESTTRLGTLLKFLFEG